MTTSETFDQPADDLHPAPSGFSAKDKPAYEDYSRCVHCGLCLNHCPTYRLWGREADSPRGRIRQMILVDQGKLELGESFVTHIDRCLDCRACETACPSGVEYGKLIELARAQIEQNYERSSVRRRFSDIAYRELLPYPRRVSLLAQVLRIYQRSGLEFVARRSGLLKVLGLEWQDALLPRMNSSFFYSRLGKTYRAKGERRARVAFFAGCVAQVAFAPLNDATIRVLQANGCEVTVPDGQLCCGALAAHAGYRDTARELAQTNIEAFLNDDCDAVITNAAGCGSTLKEYPHLFPEGEPTHVLARKFAAKMKDVTEFLAELGLVAPMKPIVAKVVYQDSCHLLHGQKVREAPRTLLRAIPGVQLIEMPFADQCCGSAGVYNITQPEASQALLKSKMENAKETGAKIIATANPGCILQMRAGARIHNTGQQVLHIVQLLDWALTRS